MILYPNEHQPWMRIYCPEIDMMFARGYIDWHYWSPRGEYYSSVKLTKDGRERFEQTNVNGS